MPVDKGACCLIMPCNGLVEDVLPIDNKPVLDHWWAVRAADYGSACKSGKPKPLEAEP
ncbi:hypothetical protein AURDEDRAFT_162610 [Auricularia subglabra TFB-10046 SS5]|nr:hypothetical protein AURDEDRAFT_162610 [Auricularia subglabra TFB-10046 SS5]